jgi:excinuclease ABC subunit A
MALQPHDSPAFITVRGAREHNLKNISVDIPRNELVVITGLSGSGKSSLSFDTIYAEGQRRYVESLSAYARQFLELMQKPDVDSIEGLSPAISIEQKTTSRNPRSTVGTITEIYDYLRLLFARIGIPHSPETGLPIQSQTVSQMVDRILEMKEGTKLHIFAPVVRGRKGEYKKEIAELRKKGFQRLKIDGEIYEIEEIPNLQKNIKHDILVLVDRVIVKLGIETRLADSLETALKLADGLVICQDIGTEEETLFSAKFACPVSGFTIEEIEPRLFSFNSPFGACTSCDGLGVNLIFDPDLVVPNKELSLEMGAIEPWSGAFSEYYLQTLESVAKHYRQSSKIPFADLPEVFQDILLYGSKEPIPIVYADRYRTYTVKKPFEGVIPNLTRRWKETESDSIREGLGQYQSRLLCEACKGHRLKPEALAVKIKGFHIGEVSDLSIEKAGAWFLEIESKLTNQESKIAERILKEIKERLHFLESVGLGYLALSRMAGTLSGGESQRIRLASQIGSGLTGVLYVLDEPSIGLHQRDNDRLIATLKRLRDLGNTVLVVEHDEDAIRNADYVIDMGPGAGTLGGEIIALGTPEEVQNNLQSLTGAYLRGERKIEVPQRRKGHEGKKLILKGASANNLKNVTVEFPLGCFICVTGVSGGGKSSLIIETLYKALARVLNKAKEKGGKYEGIEGIEFLDKVIDIDQSPIGRTPRSNPATYTGIFTPIREWFAQMPEAKSRGYSPGRFSFNVKGGRCDACQGDGVLKIEMHFLPDVYVTCDQCKGTRYNRETLEVKFRDKSIADVLDMTVHDAAEFFHAVPSIRDRLEVLKRVGLGYIKIGQAATTLSGGEAQRVKLSKELSKRSTGRTIYILDEPTTGLHFEDVRKLLEVLHVLVNQGNTIIVIEHNLEVIKTADWIIDMGPEGGIKGGWVVAEGTPEKVAQNDKSFTGYYLKSYLNK